MSEGECVESFEFSLQTGLSDRHLDDVELRSITGMIDSGIAADWDAAGVCVNSWGSDIDGFMLTKIDATLSPELEEQTVAAVATEHVSIVRIDAPQAMAPTRPNPRPPTEPLQLPPTRQLWAAWAQSFLHFW